MQVRVGALGGAFVVLAMLAFAQPAAAQNYESRFAQAQRELRRAETDERFTLAAERCQTAIARRHVGWMVVWCDLAATEAMRNRNRDGRRDYSDAERALLWDAAWLQALEGIQENSFFAAPLIERVSIADAESERRLVAYRLISGLRSRDYRDIERYLIQLGRLDGIAIGPSEGLLVGRRRLLEALVAQPRTPERLWAIAAAALTYELEYPTAIMDRDAFIADAREAAALLAGLEVGAGDLTGQDAALIPLINYAQAKVMWLARDYDGAERTGQAGYEACVTQLWASAAVCLDLGMEAATANFIGALDEAEPALMALRSEPPLTSRQRGAEFTEARCRVIIVGDADDAGAFANARIVYENPERACREMAMRYANARTYRPVSQAIPGTRRRNIVIRFVLTSP